jgi:hypothetical protein
MQEKKNIRLIVSLLLLIAATVVVSLLMNRPEKTVDKTIFKVADLKSIDQVTLESHGKKTELKFNGTKWKVNDQHNADRNLVDVLFATLQQAEPKRPVASSLRDSISASLEKTGVKVSLFDHGKMVKTFFAGGNRKKTEAYFKEEGNGAPYVMIIPGYRVYTSGVFELDENGWRDKRIFDFNWQNFKSLQASFPAEPSQNFKTSFANRSVTIEGISSVDTTRLNNYLDAVSLLMADAFINKDDLKTYDSVLARGPSVIIDITDVADRHYKLAVFPPAKDKSVPGVMGEDQYVVFKGRRISELFRKKDYFRKHD